LTVMDKYQGKRHLQRLIRMFGVEKRVKHSYVKKLYDKGWFFTDKRPALREDLTRLSEADISKGIERLRRIEETLRVLPNKECGACGCPDCTTFAEDIVDGKDSLESCVFWKDQEKKWKLKP
jgi:hypothetical protein